LRQTCIGPIGYSAPATTEEARAMILVLGERVARNEISIESHDVLLGNTLGRPRETFGDADRFMRADIAFQTRIAATPLIFEVVSKATLSWLKRYHTEMLLWSGKEKFTLAEYERIIEHIAAHTATRPSGRWSSISTALRRSLLTRWSLDRLHCLLPRSDTPLRPRRAS
jgi:hypothetical protein